MPAEPIVAQPDRGGSPATSRKPAKPVIAPAPRGISRIRNINRRRRKVRRGSNSGACRFRAAQYAATPATAAEYDFLRRRKHSRNGRRRCRTTLAAGADPSAVEPIAPNLLTCRRAGYRTAGCHRA